MKVRGPLLTCALIMLAGAVTLLSLDAYGRSGRVFGRCGLLRDSGVEKVMVDDAAEAYALWKERGFRGRTALYISDRWHRIDNPTGPPAWRPYPLRLYNLAGLWEGNGIDPSNFLFVASLKGMVRRIITVLPGKAVEEVTARARKMKEFAVEDKALYFPHEGFPRWFSGAATIPPQAEPLLVFVDAGYFGEGSPEELYRELSRVGIRSDCVILCKAVDDPEVTDDARRSLMTFASLIGLNGSERPRG